MRRFLLVVLCSSACSSVEPDSPCLTGTLADSAWCGDDGVSCGTLADRSRGCMGSHTEQDCVSGADTWVLVGGDDFTKFYYDGQELVAVRQIGDGQGACEDTWFGMDLSDCTPVGEPVQVPCEPQGE